MDGAIAMKRTSLKRSKPLRAHRKPAEATPDRHAYKEVVWGRCEVCGAAGWVRRHHCVYEQHCRVEGFPLFALENAMWVGVDWTCACHRRHHDAVQRIPLSLLPLDAVGWCYRMFGEDAGRAYLAKRYAPAPAPAERIAA